MSFKKGTLDLEQLIYISIKRVVLSNKLRQIEGDFLEICIQQSHHN
ncbi:hypothetical protein VRK_15560 [Vibrio sp. MEBiC08052]|nr:hypothetical protein VRK_15560 [Vibrio sp. MEBiC08052]